MKIIAENIGLFIIKILEIFYPLFRKFLPLETYKYAVTGGLNMVLDILLYYVFYHYVVDATIVNLGFIAISPHIAAFLFVFPITFITGFLLAKYVTFTESQIRGKKQFHRYVVSVGGSIILNYFLLKLFIETLNFYPTPGKIATVGVVVIYSFLIQKFFTFKTGKKQLAKS